MEDGNQIPTVAVAQLDVNSVTVGLSEDKAVGDEGE